MLRERAEAALGGQLVGAVITVPAYFDDAQRQATGDAARPAGITSCACSTSRPRRRSPTARQRRRGGVRFDDLGGGTFDISILRLSKGVFEVLAAGGDSALGGDDFDHRIYCWILDVAKLKPLSSGDSRLLLTRAREAKEYLTYHSEAPITARLSTGEMVDLTLTTAIFNEITQTLVAKPSSR